MILAKKDFQIIIIIFNIVIFFMICNLLFCILGILYEIDSIFTYIYLQLADSSYENNNHIWL